ncbi:MULTISPECIES: tRNA (guanosine(46)-N7)-methyltransferase TrmB [unclassified Marinobacterium]|jgi:tRNA (guanine-N7-)-methyltransferase|uniref:tRNA (guanosine(46)-N7)-methyltransferase TrmB n=1 Tax=unclassified Marinobacterium TaxID=2644139 RepID=UPI00156940A4|nr:MULTISPECIES: tRNA (guanosine(46)-N7)-methyltransferase TrmB [unclassified Marinobacterium]NRP10845.1 tRNA (guanine-N(7)-)-methyltransferase [Marinobacterium sp. xm-g-48]NRP27382.1 tRNA (guanine-N(7)-)-methyltransferase [Marinobacterium sp. xm-d-420]NRP52463.1 tRNA (guanine-N(7)-)-methyltransferase [Marinobacterium sp. xm-v-242]NRP58127.1 tRNA (guanine-N(7)-)-methyltransferase [Marinobacterium sp. xm-d-510]NRP59299.1 tRNA (guanine-N(7)-)-methyltransferase [Marinobacterium sp. xm-d-564]
MSDTEQQRPHRTIRSFVVRAGRMTEGQERAMKENWPLYGLELEDGMVDFKTLFGDDRPVTLEIGFGMGASLVEMASRSPEKGFIGIEVHPPGVGRLLADARAEGVDNIRVYCEDAIEVLAQCIPDGSLAGVQLFFPDPWHKKKHNKRRIVQPEFAQTIRQKLAIGGVFHMATDWEPYSEHMMEVMSAAEGYQNQMGEGQFSPQPDFRPVTKFQKRGEKLGHGVWDLMFERVN